MEIIIRSALLGLIVLILYAAIGTSERVDEIKELAPLGMEERNWKVLRYEGWQYGSFGNHGGKVWYHVSNIDNPSISYRVYVTLWDGELHWNYGSPEKLTRFDVNISD